MCVGGWGLWGRGYEMFQVQQSSFLFLSNYSAYTSFNRIMSYCVGNLHTWFILLQRAALSNIKLS